MGHKFGFIQSYIYLSQRIIGCVYLSYYVTNHVMKRLFKKKKSRDEEYV